MSFIGKDGVDIGRRYLQESELIDRLNMSTLWSWGLNDYGQLGDNSTTNRSVPVQDSGPALNWGTLAEGGTKHSGGVRGGFGSLLWGYNATGQLGTNDLTHYSSPVQTVAGGGVWRQIACGEGTSAGVKTDGTLWTWGYNGYGQLGNNSITTTSSPVQTVSGGNTWKKVLVGSYMVIALKTDGTLWTWGENGAGQLGTNDTTNRSSPIQTVAGGTDWKDVGCGGSFCFGIKTDGTLWGWGANTSGHLGVGDAVNKSSPVQTVAGGSWKQVSGSRGGGYGAGIKTDGSLWMWGGNTNGSLGTNDTTNRSSPIQTVAGGNNWKHVSCGNGHTAAIKTDGSIWCWGDNTYGQLGDGTTTKRSSPVQVSGSQGWTWKQVMCGGQHTNALRNQ
jgi:hypothetical protein